MIDLVKKTVLAGIGMGWIAKERLEKLGREIAEEAKLSEEQGKQLIDSLRKRSDEAREDLQKEVEKHVQTVLEKLEIPSKQDMEALYNRIDALEAKIQQHEESGHGA